MHERIKWIKENLRADAKIMVNFRDVTEGIVIQGMEIPKSPLKISLTLRYSVMETD